MNASRVKHSGELRLKLERKKHLLYENLLGNAHLVIGRTARVLIWRKTVEAFLGYPFGQTVRNIIWHNE